MSGGFISFFAFWLGGAASGGFILAGYRLATITKIYNRVAAVKDI